MTMRLDGAVDRIRELLAKVPATKTDPAWHARLRLEACEWAMDHGLPTTKDEDWRYTRLEPIFELPLAPAAGGAIHAQSLDALDSLYAPSDGTRLVFVNGHLDPERSRLTALPIGVTVTNLASILAEGGSQLRSRWSLQPAPYRHAFGALNAGLAEDGAFIELSPRTVVEEPIELVFISDTDGSPLLSSPRTIVLAGAGSRATIVETYAGSTDDRYCTNAATEVVLAECAHVEHFKVQDESESAFHLASLDVHLSRASRFSSKMVSLGGKLARHEVNIRLAGEGAQVDLDGLYMPSGDQQHDNPVLVEHAAPRCTSRQLYKGIVNDHGHGIFNGHIIVRPDALGSDACQTNKNLILSDQAEVDTRPRLEIFTDEVSCTHGAAVGRLDQDALFYLRSRGIPKAMARGLLTYGFAHEMVERCSREPLRDRMEKLVADRLIAGTGDAESRSGRISPAQRVDEGIRQ